MTNGNIWFDCYVRACVWRQDKYRVGMAHSATNKENYYIDMLLQNVNEFNGYHMQYIDYIKNRVWFFMNTLKILPFSSPSLMEASPPIRLTHDINNSLFLISRLPPLPINLVFCHWIGRLYVWSWRRLSGENQYIAGGILSLPFPPNCQNFLLCQQRHRNTKAKKPTCLFDIQHASAS